MRYLYVGAVLTALLTSSAEGAEHMQCAKRDQVIALLEKNYQEEPIALGTVNDTRLMHVYVSASGTWTILVTRTDGQACIVASGENWETLPQHTQVQSPRI